MITLKSIFWSKRSFLSGEHRREFLGFFLAEFLVFLIFLTVFLLHLFLTGFFLVLIFREKSEFLIFTFLSSFLTVFLLHLFLHLHKIIEFTSLEHSDSFLDFFFSHALFLHGFFTFLKDDFFLFWTGFLELCHGFLHVFHVIILREPNEFLLIVTFLFSFLTFFLREQFLIITFLSSFLTVFLLHLFLHLHEIIEFTSLEHSDGFLDFFFSHALFLHGFFTFLKHGLFLFWTGFLELFHGFLHVFHVIILREHNEFLLTTITSFLTGFFLVLIFREKSEFLFFSISFFIFMRSSSSPLSNIPTAFSTSSSVMPSSFMAFLPSSSMASFSFGPAFSNSAMAH